MNRREKLLGGLVALLALIMVVYFGWDNARNALARRHATLTNLRNEAKEQDRLLDQAAKATRQLLDLQKRSLPNDRERAHSAYQQWLLDLVDRLEFLQPSVQVADRRAGGSSYDQSRFEISADATLEQLTKFLAKFYSSGDLHRIHQLTIKPVPGSRRLTVLIVIEAIGLPGSQRTTVGDIASPQLASLDLQAMQDTILDRNMFFPPNEPPKFESIAKQHIVRGAPMKVVVKATDPDSWDTLAFSLVGEPPEGVKIERRGAGEAEVRWSPNDNGNYSIELEVQDDGRPRLAHQISFEVAVVDPPVVDVAPSDGRRRVVGFDDATQTFLVATLGIGDQLEAWFSIRTTGQLLKLSTGDKLDVGSFLGELVSIREKLVEISTPEGLVRVRLDQSLSDAVDVSRPNQQAGSRP
jgi:hypothetical protein